MLLKVCLLSSTIRFRVRGVKGYIMSMPKRPWGMTYGLRASYKLDLASYFRRWTEQTYYVTNNVCGWKASWKSLFHVRHSGRAHQDRKWNGPSLRM